MYGSERPQSVSVFRQTDAGAPDVIAGQFDVLPTQRGKMGDEIIGDVLGLAHGFDGVGEIAGVREDDGGDDQVETGPPASPLLLRCNSAQMM